MKIGKTLYVVKSKDWRNWLSKNHKKESEIWLIYYKKKSGKPRIPYDDAVREALCYGWIDSILKTIDDEKYAQRFSPRRPNSVLSQMNKERIKDLIKEQKMTKYGLDAIKKHLDNNSLEEFVISKDILNKIKKDKVTWKNFQNFPESYKKIRISYIERVRERDKIEFEKRLNNFIKMTSKNKKFGFVKPFLK